MDQHVGLIDDCADMAEYTVYALNKVIGSQGPSAHRFATVRKANTAKASIAIRIDNKIFEINMEIVTARAGVLA